MTLPFVREHEAAGRVAEVFSDIKATMGIATVNLIWRHLAVDANVLEYTWTAARPLYGSAALEQAICEFDDKLELPLLPVLPDGALAAVGISNHAQLGSLLDTYNRGNAYNLLTLLALVEEPRVGSPRVDFPDQATQTQVPSTKPHARFAPPTTTLPSVPELDELSADTRALVLALNALGTNGNDGGIVATLNKHAAHWPAYLSLAWSQLAPLSLSGELAALIRRTEHQGRECAAVLANARGTVASTDDETRASAAQAINSFARHAISRMVPVGQMLRQSLGAGLQ
jgi:hypothetical protein